jgi:hypothetical protein
MFAEAALIDFCFRWLAKENKLPGLFVYQCTSDLESGGYYFIFLSKTHNGTVLGIFRGGLDLFGPKIALCYAQDNLGVKKVSAPSKNPWNCPIMSFTR